MSNHWKVFIKAFKKSVAAIEDRYFQIDRTNAPATWRERAYCYELYHQLRNRLPAGFPYTLHGEIDKRGHEEISHHFDVCPNPDFIVHDPGTMNNLAVIEVKHSYNSCSEVNDDIAKIRVFIDQVGYQHGILLLFGDKLIEGIDINNEKINVLWHKAVRQPLELIAGEQGWRND